MLKIYRRIEDWHGAPDPKYRGTGGRKVLMQCGFGDQTELQRLGIPLVQHLSGVGTRAYSGRPAAFCDNDYSLNEEGTSNAHRPPACDRWSLYSDL